MGANEVTCEDKEMAGPSEVVTGAEHCSSSSRSSSSKEMVYSVGHRRASATLLITYMSSAGQQRGLSSCSLPGTWRCARECC